MIEDLKTLGYTIVIMTFSNAVTLAILDIITKTKFQIIELLEFGFKLSLFETAATAVMVIITTIMGIGKKK